MVLSVLASGASGFRNLRILPPKAVENEYRRDCEIEILCDIVLSGVEAGRDRLKIRRSAREGKRYMAVTHCVTHPDCKRVVCSEIREFKRCQNGVNRHL